MASVVENIQNAINELGEVELGGVKLEEANPGMLNVSDMTLDEHVAMQPGAIAYYGSLLKEAARNLANIKRAYDRWEKKQFAKARIVVESGTKAKSAIKVEDIKAQFIMDNDQELNTWDNRLDQCQLEYDTLHSWYEGWKQKSFSIREHAGIVESEGWNASTSITGEGEQTPGMNGSQKEPNTQRLRNVKDIIRKTREKNS